MFCGGTWLIFLNRVAVKGLKDKETQVFMHNYSILGKIPPPV
jgi:hypothetical protein